MMMGKWDAGPEHFSVDEILVLVHCILKIIEANKEFINYSADGAALGFITFIFRIMCSQR